MIFQPNLAQAVLDGKKTVTRRALSDNPRSPWWRERCFYAVGKVFTINPGRGVSRIGEARVTACDRVRMGHPTLMDAQAEGFSSVVEFMLAFMAINKQKRWEPDAEVWRVAFEVV